MNTLDKREADHFTTSKINLLEEAVAVIKVYMADLIYDDDTPELDECLKFIADSKQEVRRLIESYYEISSTHP